MDLRAVSVHVLYLSHKPENHLPVTSSDQHREMEVCFEKLTISLQVYSAQRHEKTITEECIRKWNCQMHRKKKVTRKSTNSRWILSSVLLWFDSNRSPHSARSTTSFSMAYIIYSVTMIFKCAQQSTMATCGTWNSARYKFKNMESLDTHLVV